MRIVQFCSSFFVTNPVLWSGNWAWGLPLIVVTVVIHVLGLGLIRHKAARASGSTMHRRHRNTMFMLIMGATTLLATVLHAIEAGLWAVAYQLLDALPDYKSAMLYSLNAITSYGHTALDLKEHWYLMGALEALNGWLLFGLTTAFLFAVIDNAWSLESK
jgi:MFS superfamily sulfate permease-like transporter